MMDTADAPDAPPIDAALFDRVQAALAAGPIAAVEKLCEELRAAEDFQNLFYALLLKKRVELGVSPFPTGPATDLPPETHEVYEDTIRSAGRLIGSEYLSRGDIPKAWTFYRLIGEPEPIKDALAKYQPGPDDDTYPIVEVAWQHGLLPTKGFDLILDRNGVCSAITMVSSSDLSSNPDLRTYCVQRLIRALHEQLVERIRGDLQARGIDVPASASVSEMIVGREELFADDLYHIDTSHLSSVVQMAMQLPKCPELDLARELCVYGERLSPTLKGDNDPPFDDTYADYKKYLDVIAGVDVEAGLSHFQAKLPAAAAEGYRFPAEVVVNLLLKVNRLPEALDVAKQYLADGDDRQMSCPGLSELARRAGAFEVLAEAAKAKADPVNYLAGLIAAKR